MSALSVNPRGLLRHAAQRPRTHGSKKSTHRLRRRQDEKSIGRDEEEEKEAVRRTTIATLTVRSSSIYRDRCSRSQKMRDNRGERPSSGVKAFAARPSSSRSASLSADDTLPLLLAAAAATEASKTVAAAHRPSSRRSSAAQIKSIIELVVDNRVLCASLSFYL